MKEKENGHKNRQGRLYYGSLSLAYYRHLSTKKKQKNETSPTRTTNVNVICVQKKIDK